MEKFKDLKLSEKILEVIKEQNFKEPTEIQEKTIPLVLQGKDVMGQSATGSGKTLAFGAGIIEGVKKDFGIQALILTPTRELTEQVARHLRMFSKNFRLNVKEIYGGVSINPQIKALQRADIVVGTPGRILDHMERRTINLTRVKFLVLDEADRMLDMGFIRDVEKIIRACPKERQTLLFSATISPDIERMGRNYMKTPIRVSAESYIDASKLKQIYYDVSHKDKLALLVTLLKKEESGLVMVFCNTRRVTDVVVKNLNRCNINALAIHGGLTQSRRNDILKTFNSHKALILVCTDVAARGLDIKNVSHIYNYDVPRNSTEYIHRIGRTARAGKEGIAISLVSQHDYESFSAVNEDSSLNITNVELPELEILPEYNPGNRGGPGEQRRYGDRPNQGRGGFHRNPNRRFRRIGRPEHRRPTSEDRRGTSYGGRSGGARRPSGGGSRGYGNRDSRDRPRSNFRRRDDRFRRRDS